MLYSSFSAKQSSSNEAPLRIDLQRCGRQVSVHWIYSLWLFGYSSADTTISLEPGGPPQPRGDGALTSSSTNKSDRRHCSDVRRDAIQWVQIHCPNQQNVPARAHTRDISASMTRRDKPYRELENQYSKCSSIFYIKPYERNSMHQTQSVNWASSHASVIRNKNKRKT